MTNKLYKLLVALIGITMFLHNRANAQDFVYIMPSKEIAETGEDLWFKAYQIDKQSFALSDRSQTLYLQLRTAADSVVWSEKYPLISGRANGHIYIQGWCGRCSLWHRWPPGVSAGRADRCSGDRRVFLCLLRRKPREPACGWAIPASQRLVRKSAA